LAPGAADPADMRVSDRAPQVVPAVAGIAFAVAATIAIGSFDTMGLWIVAVAAGVMLGGVFVGLAVAIHLAVRKPAPPIVAQPPLRAPALEPALKAARDVEHRAA
jgi:hypothetical protein